MNIIFLTRYNPEEMKIMKIADDCFYDGINLDGDYLKGTVKRKLIK